MIKEVFVKIKYIFLILMLIQFTACSRGELSPQAEARSKKCDKSSINSLFLSPDESFDKNCNIVGTKSSKSLREQKCDQFGINIFFLSPNEELDRKCNVVKSK